MRNVLKIKMGAVILDYVHGATCSVFVSHGATKLLSNVPEPIDVGRRSFRDGGAHYRSIF